MSLYPFFSKVTIYGSTGALYFFSLPAFLSFPKKS